MRATLQDFWGKGRFGFERMIRRRGLEFRRGRQYYSPPTGPRPTTPIGILELVLGAESTISRNRGHALLEGIEATIRSTSTTTVLGTPRRSVRRIIAQQ
jgi:hypothetical protein